jgi:hypothetical protein
MFGNPSVRFSATTKLVLCLSDRGSEILHKMTTEKNKSKRQLPYNLIITDRKH